MDAPSRLDALVAPLRADVVSGAAVVARLGADVVRRASGRIPADTVVELRAGLAEVGVQVLNAQPAMAPLVALVSEVLAALEKVEDVEAGRMAAREACNAFREGLERSAQAVASRAAALLPDDGDILTLSSSSTVRGALLRKGARRTGRVIVLESRPMQEGQMLASALAKEGLRVLFAVDAAGATLATRCAAVLLGADSVGDHGVVNKIGSCGAALAARAAGVPVLVATDESKILPPGFPQPLADDRPADEVWRAPVNVRIWNRYFEAVPLDLVSSLITESATLTPEEVEDYRRAIRLPPEVEAWARRHVSPQTEPGRPM
jgi:translation initiation factor 2B subunit (eIF-2B alpha/beta/delta family)